MTINEALRKLQAAGRIRQAWLPGMCIGVIRHGDEYMGSVRVVRSFPTYLQVTLGAEADPLNYDAGIYTRVSLTSPNHVITGANIGDPATVGCLLALLREASPLSTDANPANTNRCCAPDADGQPGCRGWFVFGEDEVGPGGATEGEAIANAIIATAEAL